MNQCPCCDNPLLRHIHHNSAYWFCSHCWQEMPNLDTYPRPVSRHFYALGVPLAQFQDQLLAASH